MKHSSPIRRGPMYYTSVYGYMATLILCEHALTSNLSH